MIDILNDIAKENEIRLFMAGDALIHERVYNDAQKPDGSYDFRPMLEYIKPLASSQKPNLPSLISSSGLSVWL